LNIGSDIAAGGPPERTNATFFLSFDDSVTSAVLTCCSPANRGLTLPSASIVRAGGNR
jgi:hypothetical protein